VKLALLELVIRDVELRAFLTKQIEALAKGGDIASGGCKLHVTLDGHRLDDAIVALVTPVVMRELAARRHSIEYDLRTMGVEV
jgi:hypothetical protein